MRCDVLVRNLNKYGENLESSLMSRQDDMRRLIDLTRGNAQPSSETMNESAATPFQSFRSWALNEGWPGDKADEKSNAFHLGYSSYTTDGKNPFNQYEDYQNWSDWYKGYAQHAEELEPDLTGVSEEEHLGNEEDPLDRMYSHHMAGHDDYFGQYDMWKGVNEEDGDNGIEVDEITGPSHWASYLVNGDDSGLEPEEKAAADAWQEKIKPWYVVSIADDPDTGESQEGRYTNHYALHSGTSFQGGNVVDYIVHKTPEKTADLEEDDDNPVVSQPRGERIKPSRWWRSNNAYYDDHSVYRAIQHRLTVSPHYVEQIAPYSDKEVDDAIQHVADRVGKNVEEIGSSDVSIWSNWVVDYLKSNAEYNAKAVDESADENDCQIYNAVKRRLMLMRIQSPALDAQLSSVSDEDADAEIKRVAEYVGNVDEIGSSDVSLWTQQVIDGLKAMADHRQSTTEDDNQLELPPLAEDDEEEDDSHFPEIGLLNNGDRYAFVNGYDKPEVRGTLAHVKAAVLAARNRKA